MSMVLSFKVIEICLIEELIPVNCIEIVSQANEGAGGDHSKNQLIPREKALFKGLPFSP